MFMYHRAPRGAQEGLVKEPAAGYGSELPRAPLPAGGAQVCPAEDAVLLGRVEPLESRQRPLLDAEPALSHVPKNNTQRD